MKLLFASQIATAGVFLLISPATVSAQIEQNQFTLPDGGTFTCEDFASRCQVMSGFSADNVTSVGGRITNVQNGRTQWTVLDAPNDVLTVGVCTRDDCTVECNFGCTCTQPDDTECGSAVVTEAPTQAPSTIAPSTSFAPSPLGGFVSDAPAASPNFFDFNDNLSFGTRGSSSGSSSGSSGSSSGGSSSGSSSSSSGGSSSGSSGGYSSGSSGGYSGSYTGGQNSGQSGGQNGGRSPRGASGAQSPAQSPTSSGNFSGAGSWQSSAGIALVTATIVSAFVGL
jgi:hypothetical protein